MPGTIKDPRMNPKERAFGYVYIEEKDGNYKYSKKKNSKNRLLVAGSIVEIRPNNIKDYKTPITIEGMVIKGTITGDFGNKTTSSNAPVINYLKDQGSNSLNRTKLDELMDGNSEVPD